MFMKSAKGYQRYFHKDGILDELIFFVTNRCNYRCRTCFYADTMEHRTLQDEKELSTDEIKKISLSIGRLDRLLISGGEPFLRDDLAEVCEIFFNQNRVGGIHLPTNGFDPERIGRLTETIVRKCPGMALDVSLPLDGLEDTHDAIRGVKGSFEKVVETADRLAELKKQFADLTTYVITVVNSANLGEIVGLAEFVRDRMPVDGHGPSPMRGTPYDRDLKPPTDVEWSALSDELMPYHRHWIRRRGGGNWKALLATNRVRYLYGLYTHVLRGERLPFRCRAGNVIGVLEPNGEVRLCELTESIGNVRSANYDFRTIWLSDRAKEMRKTVEDCACTHACFLEPSIDGNLFAFVKSYLRGRV